MCDKNECNYVAKAQNWDQRVKGEIESAKVSFFQNSPQSSPHVMIQMIRLLSQCRLWFLYSCIITF